MGELRICMAGSSAAFYQGNAQAFANFLGVTPKVTQLAAWDPQFQNASAEVGWGLRRSDSDLPEQLETFIQSCMLAVTLHSRLPLLDASH